MATGQDVAFVFVHGSWHNSTAFTFLIPDLAGKGYASFATDMYGHGLWASYPQSFLTRDLPFLKKEPSPLASVTFQSYQESIQAQIAQVLAVGYKYNKVILVGHSFGGAVISAVAETLPSSIAGIVYLAGLLPSNGSTVMALFPMIKEAGGRLNELLFTDPNLVQALRVDWRTIDSVLSGKIREILFADVGQDRVVSQINLMTPDDPTGPMNYPITRTTGKWGSIPRMYIKCMSDLALPPQAAQTMINEADTQYPQNKFQVREIPGSHSAYLSQVDAITSILRDFARTL